MSKSKGKAAGQSRKSAARSNSLPEARHDSDSTGSRLIDERIRSLGGWRAETLAEVRRLIHEADPEIVEEGKWVKPTNPGGVPVWSHAGIVCTGEAYKQVVKLTFARGASWMTHKDSSTPASRETRVAPSTSGRGRCSMRRR